MMQPRIETMNWKFTGDPTRYRSRWKDRAKRLVERLTGWRPGEFRNYERI